MSAVCTWSRIRRNAPATDGPTPPAGVADLGSTPGGRRVTGVDVARGVALFGMMAKHIFESITHSGHPTVMAILASGRSATLFALLAGVSVALMSGGQHVVRGRAHTAAVAGLAVRALLIGLIGLLLGSLGVELEVILAFYGVMFFLAIPLLRVPPKALALLAAALIGLAPVLLVATAGMDLPGAEIGGESGNPTLLTPVIEPVGTLVQLFVTGNYPVVVYMAYLCVGLAVGRLDLRSRRVAGRLLGGGLALVAMSQAVSLVLLYRLGGLTHLNALGVVDGDPVPPAVEWLWDAPEQVPSWWFLELASPHSHTPLDMTNTIGSALAVLGASLLLTRIAAVERLLGPVAAAGSMVLTLYSAHIVLLEAGPLDDYPTAQYLFFVVSSMVFAVLWRRRFGQGPLEKLVGAGATRARRAVLSGSLPFRMPAGAGAEVPRRSVNTPLRRHGRRRERGVSGGHRPPSVSGAASPGTCSPAEA
jgi:uncharacterized membrane protein YeiB